MGWAYSHELGLVASAAGVYACYLPYGMLQEQLTSSAGDLIGEDLDPVLLIWLQCTANLVFACVVIAGLRVWRRGTPTHATSRVVGRGTAKGAAKGPVHDQPGERTEAGLALTLHAFAWISLTYAGGMLASYHAIRLTNFPTTVLIKSGKMLPIMFVSSLIGGKKHSLQRWVCMVLVTVGISVFMMRNTLPASLSAFVSDSAASLSAALANTTSPTTVSQPTLATPALLASAFSALASRAVLGAVLALVSLGCDGMTGARQDLFVLRHPISSTAMMALTNVGAVVWTGAYLAVSGGTRQVIPLLGSWEVLRLLFAFCVVSALGQNFVFYTVKTYGALVLSLVTTTRKFFTIVLSAVVFGHRINAVGWVGVVVVFFALGWDVVASYRVRSVSTAGAKVKTM